MAKPEAIFLSAGVPDPRRAPQFAATADPVAIASAVSALLFVTLGRRRLVFGGQPAITPIVWTAAQDLGVDYASWVQLHLSRHFEDDFPDETAEFGNVRFSDDQGDREASLRAMREQMFAETDFAAAVFIGGMEGIVEEFTLLRERQPHAEPVPLYSTGGAVMALSDLGAPDAAELRDNLDYVSLLHERLGVSPKEERFKRPDLQPKRQEDRFWRRRDREPR